MVYLTSTFHLLALALIANVARAIPLDPPPPPTAPCDPTYGPFRLFTVTADPDYVSDIRVVKDGLDINGNTISKLSTCHSCGEQPLYWELKNSVLSPVFATPTDPSVETINLDLFSGKVGLITGPIGQLTPAPIFCAETTIASHPTSLSANGNLDLWSVCANDLYYDRRPTVAGPECKNATLFITEYYPPAPPPPGKA